MEVSEVQSEPRRPDLVERLSLLAAAGVLGIFGFLVIALFFHESKDNGGHLGDFKTFYQAAQFALAHKDIYLAGPNSSQMYVYPPLIAFLYAPFTAMPVLTAAHVALVLNTLMLLGSILLASMAMLRRLDVYRPGALAVVAFLVTVLSENELRAELMMLETDALMLLMFALALWWLDRRPILAGLALAFALNIKYLTIVALPYLVLRRRWRTVAGMIGGSVFFALLPAVLLGWREDLRCLHVALGGLLRWVGVPPEVSHAVKVHNIADDLSVSITSMLARVLGPHGFSNSRIMLLATLLGAVSLAIVAWMYRVNGFPLFRWPPASRQVAQPFRGLVAIEWAGLVTVALVFSPDTNTRHLVLTVLVNALAATILIDPHPGVARTPIVVAVLLIFVGYIMPLGQKAQPLHGFYFTYSIPCWCLLIGYLLILGTAVRRVVTFSRTSQPAPLAR